MIVLKHLSREFDIDPHRLRVMLRAEFKHRKHKRWEWDDNDPELKKIRKFLGDQRENQK